MEANQYKSLLLNLSLIPERYLVQVNQYLISLKHRIAKKDENRKEILDLAGGWNDMEENDFSVFLTHAKESGHELLGKEIEL